MRKNVLAVVSINLLQPGPALSFFFSFVFFFHNDHLNSMSFLIVITMRKALFILYCQLYLK